MKYTDSRATWDARYAGAGEDFLFGSAPNAFLAGHAHRLRAGMRALCVADGEGRNSVFLAERGLDVDAFDGSPVAVGKACRFAAARGVAPRYAVADIHALDWPDAEYDAVVAIFIQFSDPAERVGVFEGLQRVLRPGGVLLLQGYRPEQLGYGTGGPSAVENLYTPELLESAFAGMRIDHLHAHDSVIMEGRAHGGMSALIEMVAVRQG